MSVTEYYEEYLIRIDVVEVYSRTDVWNSSSLIKDGKYSADAMVTDLLLLEETTPDYLTYAASTMEKYLAMCFLRGADPKCFGKLLADLDKNYAQNQHQYPSSIKGRLRPELHNTTRQKIRNIDRLHISLQHYNVLNYI